MAKIQSRIYCSASNRRELRECQKARRDLQRERRHTQVPHLSLTYPKECLWFQVVNLCCSVIAVRVFELRGRRKGSEIIKTIFVSICWNMESSQLTAQMIMQKGKRMAAAFINADCTSNRGGQSVHLDLLLDNLLDPEKSIDNSETIDWCKWLIAGGRTPSEFSAIGKCTFYRISL